MIKKVSVLAPDLIKVSNDTHTRTQTHTDDEPTFAMFTNWLLLSGDN